MKNYIERLLTDEKIEYYGIIPFDSCKVINDGLLSRLFESWKPKSVIVFLAPYYTGEYEEKNVSLYAVPRDYHLYFNDLYKRVTSQLEAKFEGYNFKGCADHSPIAEVHAAALGGLGVIGDCFQFINEKYGSYTFIGEIYTDIELEEYSLYDIDFCTHCGKCTSECPSPDHCLSDITQKKGELNEREELLIINSRCAWGCDICRTVCPMNEGVAYTPIDFFKSELKPCITSAEIEEMGKDEFSARAYSWRGKKTILRNLKLLKH